MREANTVDRQVGRRLRRRRNALHLTQQNLAASVGVSFQQIQKYERGVNRISASRLLALCRVLDVPASYFFDAPPSEQSEQTYGDLYTRLQDCGCRELNEAFLRVGNPVLRRAIVALIEALGAQTNVPELLMPKEATIAICGDVKSEHGRGRSL